MTLETLEKLCNGCMRKEKGITCVLSFMHAANLRLQECQHSYSEDACSASCPDRKTFDETWLYTLPKYIHVRMTASG